MFYQNSVSEESTEISGVRNKRALPMIVFLGSAVTFSNTLARIVNLEFGEIDLVRVHQLSELAQSEIRNSDDIRVVVIDECLIDDLFERVEDYREAASGAQLAVAYQDIENARRVLARRQTDQALSCVSLLPLNCSVEVWLSALRILMHGSAFVPADLLAQPTVDKPSPAPPETNGGADPVTHAPCALSELTRRERQILSLVADGKRNKMIAGDLGLSEHTVKLHIHHIIRKLGVDNRTAAARWFISAGASAPSDRYER